MAATKRSSSRSRAATRKRKRSAKRRDSTSSQGGHDQEHLPPSAKRKRTSRANPSAASSADADSCGPSATEPMDVDETLNDVLFVDETPVSEVPVDESTAGETSSDISDKSNKKTKQRAINTNLPPVSDPREMFVEMIKRLDPATLKEYPLKLKVATICSGTDAPIFALHLILDALETAGFGPGFDLKHVFSCEIEPYKQGFIRRNLPPGTLIFRDVIELASVSPDGKATTAGGSRAAIPAAHPDILFAGCSCVDYSNLNNKKPAGSVPALDHYLKPDKKEKKNGSKKKGSKRKGAVETDEDPPSPVKLDQSFVNVLLEGIQELLALGKGESATTFFAALKLIADLRPKFVILENVVSAPWDMKTKHAFPKIGYVARVKKVDSKEYYLPQTRQRCYLVAVDASEIGEKAAAAITDAWILHLDKCKRAPSSSISAFLRPADDPATLQARADMSRKGTTNAEWSLCSLRHADQREKIGLRRDDNLFSKKAMRNGRLISASFPAHAWPSFWQSQVTRVIDLMDIIFASAHKQKFDLGYKTAMVDVSQNVDRNALLVTTKTGLASKLGIVGCITPSGMPVVTDLMRPITGTETLALQGLPVDELVISTETQAQLRDLAGNAMTVTVVGAVTLALLLAAFKNNTVEKLLEPLGPEPPSRGEYLEITQDKSLTTTRLVADDFPVLEELLAIADGMVRRCYCSTRPGEVVVCDNCGITACSGCRGNPEHNFGTKKPIRRKLSTEQGKVNLKKLVPAVIKLPIPAEAVRQGLGNVNDKDYRSVVTCILESNNDYYFDDIKVTETVTVCYKRADSIARLVLSPEPGSVSYWYIYVAPWHPNRPRLSATFDFEQPIARGQVSARYYDSSQWSVWTHGRVRLTLRLARNEAGALVAGNLAFAGDSNAQSNPTLMAWKRFVEEKLRGTYVHLPDCGTAGNALHIKATSCPASPVFMMWDSAPLRNADEDHFVWTQTVRRMEPHEHRETLLCASPALSWDLKSPELGSVDAFWPGYWSSPDPYPNDSEPKTTEVEENAAQLRWGSTEAIRTAYCHKAGRVVKPMPIFAAVTAPFPNFPVPAALLSRIDSLQSGSNMFYVIPPAQCDAFLKLFAFLSREFRGARMPLNLADFPHLEGKWVAVEHCETCSVTPPQITVYTKKDGKKASEEEGKGVKAIIEDPDEAALFERQYQDLPRAVAVAARLMHDIDGARTMDIMLMLQPKTLGSRARGYLLQAHRAPGRGWQDVCSQAETSFKVVLDYAPSSVTEFAPFSDSVRPCAKDHTAGINPDIKCELPSRGPPRFTRTDTVGRGKKATKRKVEHKLRSSQEEAVKWMMQRERASFDFVKFEIEEEVVAPLNLRVVGKAEWPSRFPFSSRGGVMAHEVGYGKTVVTLALLDCMRGFDTGQSITERQEKVDDAWAKELSESFEHLEDVGLKPESFFVHLSATLIIVPKHITTQWEKEAENFLGLKSPQLLVIKSPASFCRRDMLQSLQQAEIIIVSSAAFSSSFLEQLVGIAGSSRDGLGGRTLEAWYRRALRNYRILTAYFLAGRAAGIPDQNLVQEMTGNLLTKLVEKQRAEIDALVEKQVPEIDRSYYKKPRTNAKTKAKGKQKDDEDQTADQEAEAQSANQEADSETAVQEADGQTADQEAKGKGKGKGKTEEKDTNGWQVNWIHACSFSRVIWDECSYDDITIALFVANAVANAKWLISGTPKVSDLEHVCNIGSAFGVHVARPEPRIMPGLPALTNGPELSPMSRSEEFHVYSSGVKSVTLALERHNIAQTFVAAYFRANPLEEVNIESEEHVRAVVMSAADFVRYHMLNQEVINAGYDYAALPAHARSQVALKGSDLTCRGGSAQAKMMLGLVACGLGQGRGSMDDLEKELARRSEELAKQMKWLWDKAMWLHRWIRDLEKELDKKSKDNRDISPILDTLARVEIMCECLIKPVKSAREGHFEEFGGEEMFLREMAIVAGLPSSRSSDVAFLRKMWEAHFGREWADHYHKDKALHTWLDFFKVSRSSTVKDLSEKQLRLMAKDICWLRYKIDPNAAPLSNIRSGWDLARAVLVPSIRGGPRRPIPEGIEDCIANDKLILSSLNGKELGDFFLACIATQPDIPTWDNAAKKSFDPFKNTDHDGKPKKAALLDRAAELNLKTPNQSIEKLKEMLWRHEHGLSTSDNYRDGRAAPVRHRDFESALGCSHPKIDKKMETANEELKRTLVHLAKTVEDLRATALEANFVRDYAALANAKDKDCFVAKKACRGCHKLLTSASGSFLVVACGHFLCGGCRTTAGFYCPVKDCPAFIRERPVLRCSLVPWAMSKEQFAKAECVADLIKKEIPGDEYVLVFAQYGPLIDSLARAFTKATLSFVNLAAESDNRIADKLEAFKDKKAGQILLLDIDSETSAGSNLTNANHVIFANPYVHPDEEHRARTVKQAKGRCIRTGQEKKVHVYHFMVSGTIEEETLRGLARDNPAVENFFQQSEEVPWWLDGKE
ncbi:hypothetical protein N657DRAFT_170818 [Parathielavia appendiculata]|uniref:SNF2 N-terminal domain-containing protein n=1 Tax=Parathielavia appendiculata TaxID=2587402 RepID=A0AAN6U5I1_9PEZI|nr:hypothetical protein N657DRAFT_170818 [Parathielavia appendiculata]